jgi:hypothetical protein
MAITTYAELQTALANWSDRSDLTARMPEYIALAEGEMNLVLKTRRNTAVAAVTIGTDGAADVPAGFLASRTVRLSTTPGCDLEAVSIDRLTELRASSVQTGNPEVYAEQGDELVFWPAPVAEIDAIVTYYRTIPALADDNTSNWLLTAYPQVYLSGALTVAFEYMDNPEEANLHRAKFEGYMARVNMALGVNVYGDSVTILPKATTP